MDANRLYIIDMLQKFFPVFGLQRDLKLSSSESSDYTLQKEHPHWWSFLPVGKDVKLPSNH